VALAACASAVGATVNVGSGVEVPIVDLCRSIAEAAGRDDLVPVHAPSRPGDVRRLCADNGLIRELVGFSPAVRLDEGLAEVVEEFRRAGQPDRLLRLVTDQNWALA
jgi:nucleoside-diphosphate-sugar epimerase